MADSSGRTPSPYVSALEALVKAVKSHKDAGFPPCPSCDEALADAEVALTGHHYEQQMDAIRRSEDAAYRARDSIIRVSAPASTPSRKGGSDAGGRIDT